MFLPQHYRREDAEAWTDECAQSEATELEQRTAEIEMWEFLVLMWSL